MTKLNDRILESKRKLRILQLASHKNIRRGGAFQLVRLAIELKRRGHDVTCAFNCSTFNYLKHPELQVLHEYGLGVEKFNMSAPGERKRFRHWARESNYHIIHAHRDEALTFAGRALWGWRRPLIVANRGTVYRLKPLTWPWFFFRSQRVSCITAVSAAVKDSLMKSGIKERKIEVVYGSVDEEKFRPGLDGSALRAEWGGSNEIPLVGNVAALVNKKGHDAFFKAAQLVRRRIPRCRFVCIGGGCPEKFTSLLDQLNLRDAVFFTGHRQDIPHAMNALDIVVSSATKGEGLTGTVREAMSCGRPVVATDVAGNREIVRDGINGFLTPANDSQTLANAIILLLRNQELAQKMGVAGRSTVLERFTNQHRGAIMEQVYSNLLNSPSSVGHRQFDGLLNHELGG